MKKAVIYSRVSTDEQAQLGYSLRDQERCLRLFCEKNDLEVVHHYQDDHSAKDFNRPQFQQFLRDVKSKRIKVDYFVCLKQDRFSRDTRLALNSVHDLEKLGVTVKYVENNLDLSIAENIIPYLLNFGIAELENKRLSERTKKGMRQAKREGRWVGTPPRGYKSIPDSTGKKILTPNQYSTLIIEAFTEFAQGNHSTESLRKVLYARGLKVSENQFPNILKNPIYCGKIRIDEWKEEKEEIVIGIHEPLISVELFEKVQRILNGTSTPNKPHKKLDPELPLRPFLKCSCGSNLTGSRSRSRNGNYHYYYHCQNGCSVRFPAKVANKKFETFLSMFSFSEDVILLYKEVLKDEFSKQVKERLELSAADAALKLKTQNLLDNADEKYIANELDNTTYQRVKEKYQKILDTITNKELDSKVVKSEFEKYLKGVTLLDSLDVKYKEGTIEFKNALLGSIFMGKLEFSENEYRTTQINSVVENLLLNFNELASYKKEKATTNSGFLQQAPPLGLEPRTP
ncbi:recombinase family protein [Cytophaga hutchinsonii]|uniref:Site-specific recombinase n=1 Tax=Cytophaga hutchinsonii (strain ATCC 33406 / DSM 1761 / CIP 103989 / NBRC 15051 / NCIMB 9469 / D465) TaxID=269798 RepID=A0A6N4SM62_CYTH3|nr:recombinase family protein [Cytophaga hutchinsonii]ABG57345.1 site-specific recombinase [Cytophaga hutchinsonii ATCC 33406]